MSFNIFKKKPIMEFYCHPDWEGIIAEPKPAGKCVSDWYKRVAPLHNTKTDAFGGKMMTIKKCLPVLDAMSLGYVITLNGDLGVKVNEDLTQILVTNPPGIKLAEFHDIDQVGGATAPGAPAQPLKFINHWVVKTAPGWSTLFVPLVNDFDNNLFTTIGGLVDTDNYPKEVNFPAIWHAPNFEGVLPAGTPLVVAIPVKRSAMARKPDVRKMSRKEFQEIDDIRKKQSIRRHVYTSELRENRK